MTGVAAGSPPVQPADGRGVVPGPVGRRAVARLVDFALGVAIFSVALWLVAAVSGPSPDGTGIVLVSIALTFVAYWLYEVVLVAVWGRTLGKHLMRLEIICERDGGRPGVKRSMLRNLAPTVALIFLLYPLPYLAAAIAKDHRWPHDLLGGTRVVVRSR